MVEYCMLWVAVLAVEKSVRPGAGHVANEMFELGPVDLPGVDLVTAETVESKGDVGSCALFKVGGR